MQQMMKHKWFIIGSILSFFFVLTKLFFVLEVANFGLFTAEKTFAYLDPNICVGVTEIPENECRALIDIYNDAWGSDWYRNDWRWNTGQICRNSSTEEWRYGVICECNENTPWRICSTDRVRQLSLEDNNLFDSLSESIAQFTGIVLINIANNNISSLPDVRDTFNGYYHLGWLYVNRNDITTIPDSLYRNWTILLLNIGSNPISELSWAISNMPQLQFLSIGNTPFTIPPELRNRPLVRLDISHKWLTEIPSAIFNMRHSLEYLNISHNNLDHLPSGITSFIRLEGLLAHNNSITSLPTGLSNLVRMQEFRINNNTISGTLDFVCSRPEIRFLDIRNNRFVGNIPNCIQTLTHRWEPWPWWNQYTTAWQFDYNRLGIDHIDASFSGFLDTNFPNRWKQYRNVDYSLSGTLQSIAGSCTISPQSWAVCQWTLRPWDLIRLELWYSNSFANNWRQNFLHLPLIDNVHFLSSSHPFTTGHIEKTYGETNDPCFDDLYHNNNGSYRNVLEEFSQEALWTTFVNVLIGLLWYQPWNASRWISYLWDGSDAGMFFVDAINYSLNSSFKEFMTNQIGVDITTIPWCGTGEDRDTIKWDVSSSSWDSLSSIVLTWFVLPRFTWTLDISPRIFSPFAFVLEQTRENNSITTTVDTQRLSTIIPALPEYFVDAFGVAWYLTGIQHPLFSWIDQTTLIGTSAIDFLNDHYIHHPVLLSNPGNDIWVLFASGTAISRSPANPSCLPIMYPAEELSPTLWLSWVASGHTIRKVFSLGTTCSGDTLSFSHPVHIRTEIPFSGRAIEVKTSQDGISWTTLSEAEMVYGNTVELLTNHFSYFMISEANPSSPPPSTTGTVPPPPPYTPPYTPPWRGSPLLPDNCPNSDFSPSYYDGSCGQAPRTGMSHGSATIPDGPINRKELAKLIVITAQQILNLEPLDGIDCEFDDIKHLSQRDQTAVVNACYFGIMGLHKNGKDSKKKFSPDKIVSYNEAATAISRLLYDGIYNVPLQSPVVRYRNHVQKIQDIGLLSKKDNITKTRITAILQQIHDNPWLAQRPETPVWK